MKKLILLSIIGLLSCNGEQQTTPIEDEVIVDTIETNDSSIINNEPIVVIDSTNKNLIK